MVRVVAHGGRSKKSEVPILEGFISRSKLEQVCNGIRDWYFGNVPVEGIKGIEKDKEQPMGMSMIVLYKSINDVLPQTKQACFTHTKIIRIRAALECAQNNDWESAGIFQSIC